MAGLFNLAAQQAMSTLPRPVRMAQGGGLYPLIKRYGGHSVGTKDPGGSESGSWADDLQLLKMPLQYLPVSQQETVPDTSPSLMRAYFENLEEEGQATVPDTSSGIMRSYYDRLEGKEGGGISSIQKRMNIGGQPHRLAYITTDEADLLRKLGGSGRPVNGIPAYYMGEDFGQGWSEAETAAQAEADVGTTQDFGGGAKGWSDQQEADAAATQAAADAALVGSGYSDDFDWLGDPSQPGEEGKYKAAGGLGWMHHQGIDRGEEYGDPMGKGYETDSALTTAGKLLATKGNPLGLIATFVNLFQQKHPEFTGKITTLDAIIDSEWATPEQKAAAAKAKDAIEQDWYGVYGREGRKEAERLAQMDTGLPKEAKRISEEKAEEKEEEEKKGLMAQLFERMRKEQEEDKEKRYDPWEKHLGQAYGKDWRKKIERSANV